MVELASLNMVEPDSLNRVLLTGLFVHVGTERSSERTDLNDVVGTIMVNQLSHVHT